MPIIKVDNEEYEVEAGLNLIQACARIGIDIPHYCYHPGLSVSGNCRMCLVEVKGPRGTMAQIACNTMVQEGLEVLTATASVEKMRKGVMEFLLLNHPIDCPICDQAGECGLQDYYMEYARYTNRSTVPKVNKAKVVDVGPLVKLDQERCILCSRCVRFCSEITQSHELVITQRGEKSRIETFPGRDLTNPYSGNVVDICPVGALTSKDFRFKKRVWFLKTVNSLCTGCAKGCNIYLDYEKNQTYRYRPRPNLEVNDYWICDEGRLSYKKLHQNRLDQALKQGAPLSLSEAVTGAAELIRTTVNQFGKGSVLAVASSRAALEDNFILKHLSEQALEQTALCGPNYEYWGEGDNLLKHPDKTPNADGLRCLGISTEGEILEKALDSGQVKLLLILENELGHEHIQERLKGNLQWIYLGSQMTPMAQKSKYALPITQQAEHYASYVNAEQQLQKVNQAYFPLSDAKPAWQLIADIFAPLLTAPPLLQDVEDVWTKLRNKYPAFAGLTFYEIPDQGKSLKVAEEVIEA